jgi:hypothetical protein
VPASAEAGDPSCPQQPLARGEAKPYVCSRGDTQHAAGLRGPFTPAGAGSVYHGRGRQWRKSVQLTIKRARGFNLAPTARPGPAAE